MANKKKAVTGIEEKLIPFGYVEGADVVELLTAFGFNNETESIEEFIEKTWNIK